MSIWSRIFDPSNPLLSTGLPDEQMRQRREWQRESQNQAILGSDLVAIPRDQLRRVHAGLLEHEPTGDWHTARGGEITFVDHSVTAGVASVLSLGLTNDAWARSTSAPGRPGIRMVIRPLTPEDASELAELLVENREFLAPFEPVRDERFFTTEGQRERMGEDSLHAFAILDANRIAGLVTISNIVRGPFQSASLGYWVAGRLNGRGLATAAVADVLEVVFGDLRLHRLEAATLSDNIPSRRVLQKNRFEPIGLAHRYLQIAGVWRDHLLFQRTAD